jgi:hypothetical protein
MKNAEGRKQKVAVGFEEASAHSSMFTPRSVAANIAEGFRKRQYPSMFVSKLADSDAEAT